MPDVAIVTPIYKKKLSLSEIKRINLTIKTNPNRPHFFVCAESLDDAYISSYFPNSNFEKFNDLFFTSKFNYSSLMLNPKFYERFISYSYIIICQPDAFLMRDIEPILNENFLYLGSAWNPSIYVTKFMRKLYFHKIKFKSPLTIELQSGNGGLSLRKTQDILNLLIKVGRSKKLASIIDSNRNTNEDILISYFLKKFGLSQVSRKIANQYFIESTPQQEYSLDKIYGFHALNKYDPNLERVLLK